MAMMVNGQACIAQSRMLVPRRRQADVRRRARRRLRGAAGRRPVRPADPDRPARQRAAAGPGRGIPRHGGRGGRPRRRRRPAARTRDGLLRQPGAAGRRGQLDAGGPGGDLRPGDGADPVRRRRTRRSRSPTTRSTACPARCGRPTATVALAVARRMRTGMVSVNGAPQAWGTPFGGYKQSGVGREMGPEGLRTFHELKSIALGTGLTPAVSLRRVNSPAGRDACRSGSEADEAGQRAAEDRLGLGRLRGRARARRRSRRAGSAIGQSEPKMTRSAPCRRISARIRSRSRSASRGGQDVSRIGPGADHELLGLVEPVVAAEVAGDQRQRRHRVERGPQRGGRRRGRWPRPSRRRRRA